MTQSSMHLPPLRQGRRVWHTEAADTRRAERQPRPGPLLGEVLRLRQLPREQPRFPWPGGTGSRQSSAWGAPRSAGARHGNPPLLSTLVTSLAVQLLALCAFTAGAQVQSLVRELRFCKLHSLDKKRTPRTHGQVQERPRVSALPILGGPQGELAGVQRGGDVPGRKLWSREPPRVWVSPRPAPPRWPFFSHPGTQAMGGSAALWQLLAGCLSRFWAGPSAGGGCPASQGWRPRLSGVDHPPFLATPTDGYRLHLLGLRCAGDPRRLVP